LLVGEAEGVVYPILQKVGVSPRVTSWSNPRMAEENLLVLRCSRCGDTFTLHCGDERKCPSCDSFEVDLAHEPLL